MESELARTDRDTWWGLISDACAADLLDDEEWTRLVRILIGDMRADIPTRILAEMPNEWSVDEIAPDPIADPARLPPDGMSFGAVLQAAYLDGEPLALDRETGWEDLWSVRFDSYNQRRSAFSSSRSHRTYQWKAEFPCAKLEPWSAAAGLHELELHWLIIARTSAFNPDTRRTRRPDGSSDSRPVTREDFPLSWELVTTSKFTAYPSPAEMIQLVTPTDGIDIPAGDVSAEFEINEGSQQEGNNEPTTTYHLSIDFGRRPSTAEQPWIVGTVELRSGDQAWVLYDYPPSMADQLDPRLFIAMEPEVAGFGYGLRLFPDIPRHIDTVDVVIVPDPKHAAELRKPHAIWGEESVIKDVRLDHDRIERAIRGGRTPPIDPPPGR